MQIKISDATEIQLDWLLARYKGFGDGTYMRNIDLRYNVDGKVSCMLVPIDREYVQWDPSTSQEQGGRFIDEEFIATQPTWDGEHAGWEARSPKRNGHYFAVMSGKTRLVAAARAIIASRVGNVVDVPDVLCL